MSLFCKGCRDGVCDADAPLSYCCLCLEFHAEPVGKKKKTASHANDAAPVLTKTEPIGLFLFQMILSLHLCYRFSVDCWQFSLSGHGYMCINELVTLLQSLKLLDVELG